MYAVIKCSALHYLQTNSWLQSTARLLCSLAGGKDVRVCVWNVILLGNCTSRSTVPPVFTRILQLCQIWWVHWWEHTQWWIILTEDRFMGIQRQTYPRHKFWLPSHRLSTSSFIHWHLCVGKPCGRLLSQEFTTGFHYGSERLLPSKWILKIIFLSAEASMLSTVLLTLTLPWQQL